MPVVTVADVIALYLRHSGREGTHCDDSKRTITARLVTFAERYGSFAVAEMKAFHLRDFIESHEGWTKSGTRRVVASSVNAAFNWAVDEGRIDRNPFRTVRYAESEPRPAMQDITLAKVCAATAKQYERLLKFLRLTWRRVSDACNADWPDVDLERGEWVIRKPKGHRRTRKPQKVALCPEAVEILRAIREEHMALHGEAVGPIFRGLRGGRIHRNRVYNVVRDAKKRVGSDDPASTHGIRHQCGTQAALSGAPLPVIAKQMGHSTSRTTERYYVHLDGEIDALKSAVALIVPKKG